MEVSYFSNNNNNNSLASQGTQVWLDNLVVFFSSKHNINSLYAFPAISPSIKFYSLLVVKRFCTVSFLNERKYPKKKFIKNDGLGGMVVTYI
jgi:hypothetical protein